MLSLLRHEECLTCGFCQDADVATTMQRIIATAGNTPSGGSKGGITESWLSLCGDCAGNLNKISNIVDTHVESSCHHICSLHNDRSIVNERHRQACAGVNRRKNRSARFYTSRSCTWHFPQRHRIHPGSMR